ncbi:MAG: hypothetical protein WCW64_11145, partial [Phycisphaerae bacterium]
VLHSSVLSLVLWFLIVSSTIDQRKDSFYQLFKVRKILYVILVYSVRISIPHLLPHLLSTNGTAVFLLPPPSHLPPAFFYF